MYADPKLIKKHRQSMNLDDYHQDGLERLHRATGLGHAVIAREVFGMGLEQVIHRLESAQAPAPKRVALSELLSA
ncbi:hypothetical protein GCM10010975_26730 [Comamonas phosphati]|nr:hypothetical protein GCM10010975_26730 [Comamonas phosphati]